MMLCLRYIYKNAVVVKSRANSTGDNKCQLEEHQMVCEE